MKVLKKRSLYIFFLAVVLLSYSCKPTRFVEDGEYLLRRNNISLDNKTIDKKELESYYRQQPNKRFLLLFNFNLAAYNFSQLGKERKWKKWIGRVIGEEPSIYDSLLTEKTIEQFEKFLKNEAFYNAKIYCNNVYYNKRVWVNYIVKTGKPIIINSVNYEINDSLIKPLILRDTIKTFLKRGKRMTLSALEQERNRIVVELKDSGYFKFTKSFIRYRIDTVNKKADIVVIINKNIIKDSLNNPKEEHHKRYLIDKVYFIPNFNPQRALKERQNYLKTFDTTYYKGYAFIYSGKQNIKPKTILKANTIKQGSLYNYDEVNSMARYINSLRLFRSNNINFYTKTNCDTIMDCVVQLTPSVYQNYSVNFETTNTQGNFGVGGFVNYKHKNLFKGAEIFNIKVSGSLQRQTATETSDAFNIYEYGIETGLETPSFLLPFKMDKFYKKFNPKTNLAISYNYQQRPDYKRTIYNASMGYLFSDKRRIRYIVSPIDIASVYVDGTQQFMDSIRGTYLENSYKDYLIAGANFSLMSKNNRNKSYKSYSYYRWNVGIAGNLLNLYNKIVNKEDTVEGGYYKIFKLQYAQYALTDIDYRYYYYLDKTSSVVSRAFLGVAVPYGNASAIPFVKQYYSGGAQGIRAWHPKDLGPGTYKDTLESYPNQTADIKLEFNIEYRYSFNQSWKGAFFLDVGNIWSISKEDERPGAVFEFNKFYKQLAVGTGFGIRYDLEFAIFRVDWGIKVRDPAISGTDTWVLFYDKFSFSDDIIWHFAIGYPF